MDEQTDVSAHVVHHAVGFEDEVGAAAEPGPELVERLGKFAVRSGDQQRACSPGGQIAGGVGLLAGDGFFPDGAVHLCSLKLSRRFPRSFLENLPEEGHAQGMRSLRAGILGDVFLAG